MSASQRLRIREIRDIAELVGQVGEIGRNPTAWRIHALNGLRRLVDGSVAMTLDMGSAEPGSLPQLIDPLDVGWDEKIRQIYLSYYTSGVVVQDPGAEAVFDLHRRVKFLTMTRTQVIDDDRWYASPAVSEYRKSGNVDDFVSTSVIWPVNWLQGFIVYRPWRGSRFEPRHRRIVRLFHLGLMRLYQERRRDTPGNIAIADLPPRVAQTFDLLLMGDAAKEIASKLYISLHTVNDYTKLLYRRLDVTSRGQLLSKFLPQTDTPQLVLPRGMEPPPWPVNRTGA